MLQASSDGSLTLVNIALDLQILICTLLHPFDILTLRATCKNLQLATRKRVVWLAALHRVCLDNSLFLPSFPIPDMSDVELEHAAIGPRRWIELCASFEKRHPNDSYAKLHPRTTRIFQDSSLAGPGQCKVFIVPGGRYMVVYSINGIFVWDLGYTSSADCKLIASARPEGGSSRCMVQATPDGMGLVILSCRFSYGCCSVYEIYPQSETPQLTLIARLDSDPNLDPPGYLLPDRVLWFSFYDRGVFFRVWDYRMNHSTYFSGDVDMKKFQYNGDVIATKTTIILICAGGILLWTIPPLSPQPPDFFNYNATHIPSLFGIALPDGILSHGEPVYWQSTFPWYSGSSGSSQRFYFHILDQGSKLHRFEIIVKPDLFDTTLQLINTEPHDLDHGVFQRLSICEDTSVVCWIRSNRKEHGVYTGLMSSRSTAVISHGSPAATMLFPPMATLRFTFALCPASGRYGYFDDDIGRLVVVDFF